MEKDEKNLREVSTAELVATATDKSGDSVYANHAQFSIGQNEIFIDLFLLGPTPTKSSVPQGTYVKRIIIPFTLVKGFVSALANLVARFEKDTNQALPDLRGSMSEDVLKVWK